MEFNYQKPDDNKDPLTSFGRNINNDVKANKIDPVIGRDQEIKRLIEILSRKNKNNPILIGEPGVGKTAIVEGFVQRIVNKDVPANLVDKEVYELSLSSLISGASYQGQFEQRLQSIIKQVKQSAGKIILFIDEIHQLVGTGKNAEGSMDAANILKPMMARGEVKIIGATTLDEYRQYIEKDSALERRMQKIIVNEPSKQEALTIMRGLKQRWEMFHQVKIHDSALIAAVNLSDRYITDRYLPDKAIDLIDEAAAKVKTQLNSLPADIDFLNREIIHLETAKAALSKEEDEKSKKNLQEIEQKLEQIKKTQKEKLANWNKLKTKHDQISNLKKEIEKDKFNVEYLQQQGEFVKASKLLYEDIPQKTKSLKLAETEFERLNGNMLFSNSVTVNEVSQVISESTGIPIKKLLESEKEKFINLDKEIKKIVKGQNNAVEIVTKAILRSKAGINDPEKPIGSFLFLGPTGVGKTLVAKTLALNLFDSQKAMIRFDMSEYMEKHSVAKLIGAPPGYVGYEQGGLLTEAIRRKPYAVVLFDEIEKAHPDVLNILLQVLDDGQLKDSHGKFVNFKNTIIIMTSNIGSQYILDNKNNLAIDEMKKILKHEFINRIDEIIIFNKLDNKNIAEIVNNQLANLQIRLKNENYNIEFKNDIVDYVIKSSYDPIFGARPIRRFIQHNIENYLAATIINNTFKKNIDYVMTLDKNSKNKICVFPKKS